VRSGLLLNDELVVEAGVTEVGGQVLVDVFVERDGDLALDPDGTSLAFRGSVTSIPAHSYDDALQLYTLPLAPWVSVGRGVPPSAGPAPRLVGSGSLLPASPATISVRDGLPGGSATLVLGLGIADAALLGGVLWPSPTLIVPGLPLDGDGSHSIEFNWPTGMPAGVALQWQAWLPDAAGPAGFSATNGLTSTTP